MKIKASDPVMTRAEIQAALDRLNQNLPRYEDFSPEKFDPLARLRGFDPLKYDFRAGMRE